MPHGIGAESTIQWLWNRNPLSRVEQQRRQPWVGAVDIGSRREPVGQQARGVHAEHRRRTIDQGGQIGVLGGGDGQFGRRGPPPSGPGGVASQSCGVGQPAAGKLGVGVDGQGQCGA
ncbi:hypothetical protein GCM10027280_53580 [Micromonospora polyrhachis]|uniref:Uncharacterized protein n=1 Tax=Micromonospora polyrhachis TaxID=1282883 RepID=A0A7W7WLN3_9ACTN|nr:hypothetical protein [Micromonospora polyrhachis]MBB4956311.1 hypothetical protein [Micromonospora polyrhachis]